MSKINKICINILLIVLIIIGLLAFVSCIEGGGYDFANKTFVLHASGQINVNGKTYDYTNSIDNFIDCYNAGFRYFEYDFILSTDGKVIGAHDYRYMPEYESTGIDYQTHCNYLILGKLKGVTVERLIEVLYSREDAYIVLDIKEGQTVSVIDELVKELNEFGHSELIKNFIPQLYTYEMYQTLESDYSFERYIYTNYISGYSIDQIKSYFSADEKVFAITLWDYYSKYDILELRNENFEVYLHTINQPNKIQEAFDKGATGVYTDNTNVYDYVN